MRLSSLLLGFGLFAVACAPPAAPAALSAAELDAVKAVNVAAATAFNAKDTTAFFALWAADAKVLAPDSPVLDGAAGHPPYTSLMAGGASEMTLTETTAYGVGDLAYVVGMCSWKMGGARDSVKYTEVLRKGTDGKWRYVVDMFSSVAPAAKK